MKILSIQLYLISQILTKLTKLDTELPHVTTKSNIESINLAYYIDFSQSKGKIQFTPSHGGKVEALSTPAGSSTLQLQMLPSTILGVYKQVVNPITIFRVTAWNDETKLCQEQYMSSSSSVATNFFSTPFTKQVCATYRMISVVTGKFPTPIPLRFYVSDKKLYAIE